MSCRTSALLPPSNVITYFTLLAVQVQANDRLTVVVVQQHVVWLTTVTDSGVPSPNPVWFVPDGDDLVVFTAPESRKVQNVRQRPTVTLNFNSDPPGGDIVVIKGTVSATPNVKASGLPGYLDKYETAITGELGTTVAEIDRIYSTELRITPTRVRLTPG